MFNLSQELMYEIEWRIEEITRLKTLPYLRRFNEEQKEIYLKSIIPIIYAYLEGYVKKSFEIYINVLNSEKLEYNALQQSILLYIIESKYNCFEKNINDYNKKIKLIENVENELSNIPLNIPHKVKLLENINCERLNKILSYFNLESLNEKEYKDKLNKLLQYRNTIAHGENALKVNIDLINEFISTVTQVMDKIFDILVIGYKEKSFIRSA